MKALPRNVFAIIIGAIITAPRLRASRSDLQNKNAVTNFQRVKNNSTFIFFLGWMLVFAGCITGHATSEQKTTYGTRAKYVPGQKIEFPDFTIEYIGERQKTVPVYPRPFIYYDFKVSKGKAEKMVSWTSGSGLIGPMDFEIRGKHYQLELRHSDKLGKLQDNELVIWQAKPPS